MHIILTENNFALTTVVSKFFLKNIVNFIYGDLKIFVFNEWKIILKVVTLYLRFFKIV